MAAIREASGSSPVALTDRHGQRVAKLIRELDDSVRQWDLAYPVIIEEAQRKELKMTEEKLRITVRNELRQRGFRIPEVIRWELRAALGGVEGHE